MCLLGGAVGRRVPGRTECPKFAHIVAGDFGRTGDMLWWTLEVEEIPAEMTFNQADVPGNFLEYRWAVDIDSDRNGAVDLRASVEHFALLAGTQVTTADILSQTNHNLLEVRGGVAVVVGTIDASISRQHLQVRDDDRRVRGPGGGHRRRAVDLDDLLPLRRRARGAVRRGVSALTPAASFAAMFLGATAR